MGVIIFWGIPVGGSLFLGIRVGGSLFKVLIFYAIGCTIHLRFEVFSGYCCRGVVYFKGIAVGGSLFLAHSYGEIADPPQAIINERSLRGCKN